MPFFISWASMLLLVRVKMSSSTCTAYRIKYQYQLLTLDLALHETNRNFNEILPFVLSPNSWMWKPCKPWDRPETSPVTFTAESGL
jgi:hypothetical protein